MRLFTLEHGKLAYRADFVLYGFASAGLAALLVFSGPPALRLEMAGAAMIGLTSWTLMEYLLHRFVLHGLPPFSTWHAEHHQRPVALICTPTLLSATLIATLVFGPTLAIFGVWLAAGVTLGILTGYLAYTVTHHATHHWRAANTWTRQRKRWHALHHGPNKYPGHYGVTSGFWDYVFGSANPTLRRD